MNTVEDLARNLYEAYVASATRGNPTDPKLPVWHQLTGRRRRAWVAVAGAACSALRTRPGAHAGVELPPLELLHRGAPHDMAVSQ